MCGLSSYRQILRACSPDMCMRFVCCCWRACPKMNVPVFGSRTANRSGGPLNTVSAFWDDEFEDVVTGSGSSSVSIRKMPKAGNGPLQWRVFSPPTSYRESREVLGTSCYPLCRSLRNQTVAQQFTSLDKALLVSVLSGTGCIINLELPYLRFSCHEQYDNSRNPPPKRTLRPCGL